MDVHEQYAEDLALYALNALSGAEREDLEKHLVSCAACRRELEQLRADGALLAISVAGSKPPQRSRERLMGTIAREPRLPTLVSTASRPSWWAILGWAAAAAMVVFAILLWRENSALKQNLAALNATLNEQTAQLERSRDIVTTLTATDVVHVTLVAGKTRLQPQGKAFYLRDRGSLIFVASNMPKLKAQKAYELWLIPVSGAPIPAGIFKPDARGNATVVNPPLPLNTEAKAFAITVENEAGASAPTMPIVMMGAGE
jgi:anti-sigma-K factor RskA